MAKIKMGKWEFDEDELDAQHQEAIQRGAEWVKQEPQAQATHYDATNHRLVIDLKNGVQFLIPCSLIQGLATASPTEIAQVRLGPRGASLHWEALDIDLSLAGLLSGVFGTAIWMAEIGRRGGRARSTAKTSASQINGRKGGRPRRLAVTETP